MIRLVGLLAGLAAVTDLGTGGRPDESLHRCVLAVRLAKAAGLEGESVRDALLVSLLQHVGCTAYAVEAARAWGDDVAATHAALRIDPGRPSDVLRTFVPILAKASGRGRPAIAVSLVRAMPAMARDAPQATCEVAKQAGLRLGLGDVAQESLGNLTAMWNGHGFPATAGELIPLPARVMHVASAATLAWVDGGLDAAREEVARRSGRELDPGLAAVFLAQSGDLFAGLDELDPLPLVLDAEPDPVVRVDGDRLLEVAVVCGDVADLKSPWLHGHSRGVGSLAGAAAELLGLREADDVRVAGHLHDVGRVGIRSSIWDVTRPWSAAEQDQVRLHSYYTERALSRAPELAGVASLAGAHHEHCDGSGYHRGLRGDRLPIAARVLAAADRHRTLVEPRAHRSGLSPSAAHDRLQHEARAGRLDADAVGAVLAAADGSTTSRRVECAGGLTPRQLDVLRLVTHGLSNRQIADRLSLSPRTVDRHVADVYARIGVTSRAGAALHCIEHGLCEPDSARPG